MGLTDGLPEENHVAGFGNVLMGLSTLDLLGPAGILDIGLVRP